MDTGNSQQPSKKGSERINILTLLPSWPPGYSRCSYYQTYQETEGKETTDAVNRWRADREANGKCQGHKVTFVYILRKKQAWIPRWLSGKEPACQCRRHGFDPWVGKIPWRKKWLPTPVFLPRKSQGQRSLAGYRPWGHKRVRHDLVTEHTSISVNTVFNCLAGPSFLHWCHFWRVDEKIQSTCGCLASGAGTHWSQSDV